jgi:hypothetical protein
MIRLVLTMTLAWGLVPQISFADSPATPAPSRQLALTPRGGQVATKGPRSGSRAETPFVITNETEIRLDSRPCFYAEVPAGAAVTAAEVAADRKTVLRIHFRSPK